MKKIINGKKYDTETAREVGSRSNGLSYKDFSWVEEALYQKKTGEFFLHGEGGPATRYAYISASGGMSIGESIIPLTEDEAKKWGEKYMDVDQYEAIFGEVEE